eukprot:1408640-Pleurochrysis_carterae.AAC.1
MHKRIATAAPSRITNFRFRSACRYAVFRLQLDWTELTKGEAIKYPARTPFFIALAQSSQLPSHTCEIRARTPNLLRTSGSARSRRTCARSKRARRRICQSLHATQGHAHDAHALS